MYLLIQGTGSVSNAFFVTQRAQEASGPGVLQR